MKSDPALKKDKNFSDAKVPVSEIEQSEEGSQPSSSDGEPWLLKHTREVFEPDVVLYDPWTLDLLPEAVVMEHYLLLGDTIRRKKLEYAQGDKHHEDWKAFIWGLMEAQLLME